jgi:hypothetical protein
MARVPDRGTVGRRVLVNYFGPKRSVNGAGNSKSLAREHQRHLRVREIFLFQQ